MRKRRINHRHTSEMVCPYCGCEQSDPLELTHDSSETYCDNCEEKFGYEREYDVTYTTSKLNGNPSPMGDN